MNQREEYVLGRDVTDQAKARESRGTVVISFRISSEEFDALTEYAGAQRKTVSQIAREAFREGLTSRSQTQWAAMSFAGGSMVCFGDVVGNTFVSVDSNVESVGEELEGFTIQVPG